MLKKLRIKFICINMMTVFIILLVMFALLYHTFETRIELNSISAMRDLAGSSPILGGFQDTQGGVYVPYFIVDIDYFGNIVASESRYYELPDRDVLLDLLSRCLPSGEQCGVIEDYSLRFYRASTLRGERIVFADVSGERTALVLLLKSLLAIGVASLGLFFLISYLLARWAVKPVDKVWQQQRQFVSDASHELKTPLTVIMANAQLLSPETCPDEAAVQRFQKNILSTCYKMRELIEQLLDLARADNAPDKTSFEPLDFSGLVYDALLPFEPVFFERGLDLCSDLCPNISVFGSAAHLKQLAGILFDNAQKYSAPGKVSISLVRHDRSKCLLTVSNPGEEMSRDELKNIFKRFYRADQSRSSEGYGLGLSIAESIAAEHKGKLWAESGGGMIRFQLLLPICKDPAPASLPPA